MSEIESSALQSCEKKQHSSQSRHQEEVEESEISFDPPVYRQRYTAVGEIINHYQAKNVLDFGCAEGKFLRYLIRNEKFSLAQLVGVDIDGELLKENSFRIEPLLCDWLQTRESPFTVSMLQGSISEADDRFYNYDLISCIEIIEHLIPEHLDLMPAVVFGQLLPKVAIVTTPNADFNVLFPNLKGFRHWDHKFEWTRQEFQEWATTQANEYGYSVRFQGIGSGPVGTEHLGCCSQMALFERKDSTLVYDDKQQFGQPYKLIKSVDYPYRKSTISKEQKIIYEVERLLWFLSQPTGGYENEDDDTDDYYDDDKPKSYELLDLFKMGRLKESCGTVENLRLILEASSLCLSSDGKSVIYSLPKWDDAIDNSEDDSWDDVKNNDSNNEIIDTSPQEDWDAEENTDSQKQNENVCWHTTNTTSIYWDGEDHTDPDHSVAVCNDYGSGSDNENSNVDCKPWALSNWYETQRHDHDDFVDDDDANLDDCASGDDTLPWITSDTAQ